MYTDYENQKPESSFSPWWASWWKPVQSTVLGRILLVLTFWIWIPYFIVAGILHGVIYEVGIKMSYAAIKAVAVGAWVNVIGPCWSWIKTGKA